MLYNALKGYENRKVTLTFVPTDLVFWNKDQRHLQMGHLQRRYSDSCLTQSVLLRSLHFGFGLHKHLLPIAPQNANGIHRAIGICGENRIEWFLADFACAFFGWTVVPLHTEFDENVRQKFSHINRSSSLLLQQQK